MPPLNRPTGISIAIIPENSRIFKSSDDDEDDVVGLFAYLKKSL